MSNRFTDALPRATREAILVHMNSRLQEQGQRGRFRSVNCIPAILEADNLPDVASANSWLRSTYLGTGPNRDTLYNIFSDTTSELFRATARLLADKGNDYFRHKSPLRLTQRCVYTWNINSATSASAQEAKLRPMLSLVQKGPICLQETRWNEHSHTEFKLKYPTMQIVSSPGVRSPNGGVSGGVAVCFSSGIDIVHIDELVPGYALAVTLKYRHSVIVILSVYAHPTMYKRILTSLSNFLNPLLTPFVVGADFNQLCNEHAGEFQRLLDTSRAHHIRSASPTFRRAHIRSNLDGFLLANVFPGDGHTVRAFWPAAQRQDHAVVCLRLMQMNKLKVDVTTVMQQSIPADYFVESPAFDALQDNTSITSEHIVLLHRQINKIWIGSPPLISGQAEAPFRSTTQAKLGLLKSAAHVWHRTLVEKRLRPTSLRSAIRYFASKLNAGNAQVHVKSCWLQFALKFVSLPECVTNAWSPDKAISTLTLVQTNDIIQRLELVAELSKSPLPSIRSYVEQRTPLQASSHRWANFRQIVPKTKLASNHVVGADGRIATTVTQYDQALRETRQFWEVQPIDHCVNWDYILQEYQLLPPFPVFPPPTYDVLLHAVVYSKDSAPGPDGIPYAFYRTVPDVSAKLLQGLMDDCILGQLPPPSQALVFIPKADLGAKADNYRPLDMPDCIDRLLDSAVYAVAANQVGPCLHQAQSLVNIFKEPPGNYAAMQDMLDDNAQQQVVMLTDLAKAFERVNPGWLLDILQARGAPYWLYAYTTHLLYGRKTRHRIQGHLLPHMALRQGLAMGRATSVLLFCIAMDPLICRLNKVPRVLALKAYMDDNGTAGAGIGWIQESQRVFISLEAAGIVVLQHQCIKAHFVAFSAAAISTEEVTLCQCSRTSERGYSSLVQAISGLLGKTCHTIHDAFRYASELAHDSQAAGLALCIESVALFVPIALLEAELRSSGTILADHGADFAALLRVGCSCKCKTSLLSSQDLTPSDLWGLDETPWGARIVTRSAGMLGYVLRGAASPHAFESVRPNYYLDVVAGTINTIGEEEKVRGPEEPHLLAQLNVPQKKLRLHEWQESNASKAMLSIQKRFKASLSLQASCPQRALFFSSYMHSCGFYVRALFNYHEKQLRHIESIMSKVVIRRPWIQAKHLPGTFYLLGIKSLGSPRAQSIVSQVSLLLRWHGRYAAEWLLRRESPACLTPRPFLASLVRTLKGYLSAAREQFEVNTGQNFDRQLNLVARFANSHTKPTIDWPALCARLLGLLKQGLREAAAREAREYLGAKLTNLPYPHYAFRLLTVMTRLPLKHLSAVNRLYALRWLTGEETDDYFVYRQFASRNGSCALCRMETSGALLHYPQGYNRQPVCEDCLRANAEQRAHVAWGIVTQLHKAELLSTVGGVYKPALLYPMPDLADREITPRREGQAVSPRHLDYLSMSCPFCGKGSLSTLHWMYWCPITRSILLIVWAHLKLPDVPLWEIVKTASEQGDETALSAVELIVHWIATLRRYVLAQGYTWQPTWEAPIPRPFGVRELQSLASRLWDSIHKPTSEKARRPPWYISTATPLKCLQDSALEIIVPTLFHNAIRKRKPVAVRSRIAAQRGSILAILPTNHSALGALYTTCTSVNVANIHLEPFGCTCGKVHLRVVAADNIAPGQQITLHQGPRSQASQLLVQFDGSCHKECKIGGAGVVAWSPGAMPTALEVHAIPIVGCEDSFQAEVTAACKAVAAAITLSSQQSASEVVVQGDCIAIIRHFTGAYRVRRPDLVSILQDMWKRISTTWIPVRWSYVPRAGNRVADFLAGAASNTLKPRPAIGVSPGVSLGPGGQSRLSYLPDHAPQLPEYLGFLDDQSPDLVVVSDIGGLRATLLTSPSQLIQQTVEALRQSADTIYLLAPSVHNVGTMQTYSAVYGASGLPINSSPVEVMYTRSSVYPQGRYYPKASPWGNLPRQARHLALGPDAYEVDLQGCFYTLARLLGDALSEGPIGLPRLHAARQLIAMHIPNPRDLPELRPKLLLQVLFMKGSRGFASYLTQRGVQVSVPVWMFTQQADICIGRVTDLAREGTSWYFPDPRCNERNTLYFFLEAAEAVIVRAALRSQIEESGREVLWIHDGFYTAHPPNRDRLRQAVFEAIQILLASFSGLRQQDLGTLLDLEDWLRVENLAAKHNESLQELVTHVADPSIRLRLRAPQPRRGRRRAIDDIGPLEHAETKRRKRNATRGK